MEVEKVIYQEIPVPVEVKIERSYDRHLVSQVYFFRF